MRWPVSHQWPQGRHQHNHNLYKPRHHHQDVQPTRASQCLYLREEHAMSNNITTTNTYPIPSDETMAEWSLVSFPIGLVAQWPGFADVT